MGERRSSALLCGHANAVQRRVADQSVQEGQPPSRPPSKPLGYRAGPSLSLCAPRSTQDQLHTSAEKRRVSWSHTASFKVFRPVPLVSALLLAL